MFCQVLRAWLQPGAQCLTSSCRSVHKLASINSTKNLSQNKVGGMLYPFSVLEPYLDRFVVLCLCCSAVLTLIGFTASLQTVLLRRSVDRTPFQLFHPSVEDMVKAEKIFCSSPSHRIEYYTSAERMEHAPTLQQPEVTVFSITSNT